MTENNIFIFNKHKKQRKTWQGYTTYTANLCKAVILHVENVLSLNKKSQFVCFKQSFRKCRCHSFWNTKPYIFCPTSHYHTCSLTCGSSSLSTALCRSNATTGEHTVLTETLCSGCSSTHAPSTDPSSGLAKGSWMKLVLVSLFRWYKGKQLIWD